MAEAPAWRGVVLAGGRSERMGRDKAGLRWQGLSWLEHARARLAAVVGTENVFVSGAQGVPDAAPGLGPLGGIASVAARVPADAWLLVLPVDMPLLREGDLSRLGPVPGADVAAMHFSGAELPCGIRCDGRARVLLAALCSPDLQPRQRSLRAFLDALGAQAIPPEGARERLANLNSPEEWERLHEAAL